MTVPRIEIESGRMAGDWLWLVFRDGRKRMTRRIACVPEPRRLPPGFRGFYWRQTGPDEIEVRPALSFHDAKGRLMLTTPHAWRTAIVGGIPEAPEPAPVVDYVESARRERESAGIALGNMERDIIRALGD